MWAGWIWLELGNGLRTWRRSPAVAGLATLTLTLGIGASTLLFSVVHGVLLQPLPYDQADRLVVVRAEQDFEGASRPVRTQYPLAAVAAWPTASSALATTAFHADGVGALAQAGGATLVDTAIIEGPFFETVRGRFLMGRGLTAADAAEPVAVISARLWRQHFQGDPAALGKTITLNGRALTVIGVADDAFQWPRASNDVWMHAAVARAAGAGGGGGFAPIARLRAGATLGAAADEVRRITDDLGRQLPRALGGARVRVVSLHDAVTADARPVLLVLSAAVGLLLLLASANVANLLLARNAIRAHEVGVRRALGASSARLAWEALVESAWLAAAAALGGTALAVAGVLVLRGWSGAVLPRLDSVRVDGAVLGFAVAVSAAVVVALVPAVWTGDVMAALREGRGRIAVPRARVALRFISVVQLSLSVVLLVVAVLMGRSLLALLGTDVGVTTSQVATASINLAMDRTLSDAQQVDLVARIVDRAGSLPGVTIAAVGTSRPPDVSRMRLTLTRPGDTGRASYQAAGIPVTPGYFEALGIRLAHGRWFTGADRADAPQVVILSASTARRLFDGRDAVGQTIQLPMLRDGKSASAEMTVVGVAADVKFNGLDQPADDVVYRPFAQQPWRSGFLIARTTGDPAVAAESLRRAVAAVDGAVAVSDTRSLEAVLSGLTASPRLRTIVLGLFAGLAVMLAAIGLYGVLAYSVSQRRAEIGVRMALGADAARIRRMVLREALGLLAVAAVVGALGAAGASRAIEGLLFGTAPFDPVSFLAAVAGVLAVGLAASDLPARRAARTDPALVLKGD